MVKATPAQIRACYDAAVSVNSMVMRRKDAIDFVVVSTEMKKANAGIVISVILLLLRDRTYTRNITADVVGPILKWIAQDFGESTGRAAATRVKEHIDSTREPRKALCLMVETFLGGLAGSTLESRHLDIVQRQEAFLLGKAHALSQKERAKLLPGRGHKPRKMAVTTSAFLRNQYVVAEVLFRAGGQCGQCRAPAPFTKHTDQSPYLEVHHRIPLVENGDDTVENAIALCPNCHREAHHGLNRSKFRPTPQ